LARRYVWFLAANSWILDSPSDLDVSTTTFGEMTGMILVYATVIIAIAEKLVTAVRLPDGAAYRFVGGNRWLAAAVLGAITGLTVGLGVEYYYLTNKFGDALGIGWEVPVCVAVGFVSAEAIVGRRFRSHREERSLAS
jgi:hypothetical protein